MTDQTRWGIDQVQTKNKAIRRQKDIINRAISEIDKLEEEWFLELMLQLEGIYETKYGQKRHTRTINWSYSVSTDNFTFKKINLTKKWNNVL